MSRSTWYVRKSNRRIGNSTHPKFFLVATRSAFLQRGEIIALALLGDTAPAQRLFLCGCFCEVKWAPLGEVLLAVIPAGANVSCYGDGPGLVTLWAAMDTNFRGKVSDDCAAGGFKASVRLVPGERQARG
ncbi:MAG: hypothetical protein IT509_03745 [Rhodocyclaceae bacterium]|nr:hypothetical protein [Rhodocyclaceae bacterium]